MVNENILFGLHMLGNDVLKDFGEYFRSEKHFLSAITRSVVASIPLGSPIMFDESSFRNVMIRNQKTGLTEITRNKIRVDTLSLFPPSQNFKPCFKAHAAISDLSMPKDSWIYRHKFIEVGELDMSNILSIVEYIHRKAPITFILRDKKQAAKSVMYLKEFSRRFKYEVLMSHESRGLINLYKDDSLLTSFTFLRLQDCIPIFNTRKLDGVGIMVSVFGEDISNDDGCLALTSRLSFILTNYKDNVFIVDGTKVLQHVHIKGAHLSNIAETISYKHNIIERPNLTIDMSKRTIDVSKRTIDVSMMDMEDRISFSLPNTYRSTTGTSEYRYVSTSSSSYTSTTSWR